MTGVQTCALPISLAGRTAKDNDAVISTATEATSEAVKGLRRQDARPAVLVAFDCGGRKGKLDNVRDELAAIHEALGSQVPLFGSYNAGEIGPADLTEKKPDVLSCGVGWHIMIGAIGWGE